MSATRSVAYGADGIGTCRTATGGSARDDVTLGDRDRGSSWKQQEGRFTLSAVVPPNTTATVVVPSAPGVTAPAKARLLRHDSNGDTEYGVPCGRYTFSTS